MINVDDGSTIVSSVTSPNGSIVVSPTTGAVTLSTPPVLDSRQPADQQMVAGNTILTLTTTNAITLGNFTNTGGGVYTCTVAGLYQLSASFTATPNGAYVGPITCLIVQTSLAKYIETNWATFGTLVAVNPQATILAQLAIGDTIRLRCGTVPIPGGVVVDITDAALQANRVA